MTMEETPRQRWREYLDQFSRAHHDAQAHVQMYKGSANHGCDVADLPLLGITAEHADDQDEQIQIMLGRPTHGNLSHTIEHPVRVRSAEWNDGYSGSLQIESADGSTTTIQVGPPQQTLPPGIITDGVI